MTVPTGTLKLGSTNVGQIARFKDKLTGLYLSTATGSLSLYDDLGAPVTGAQNLAMPYTAGTPSGFYRGVIPSTVVLVDGTVYDARATLTAADGSVRLFHIDLTAERG